MKEFGKLRIGRWFIYESTCYVKTSTDCATLMTFNDCDGIYVGPCEVREFPFSYDSMVQPIKF